LRRTQDIPVRIIFCFLLNSLSMALSNERMVSKGRSHRERVGLERSGSAVAQHVSGEIARLFLSQHCQLTDDLSVAIKMWDGAKRLQRRRLKCSSDCRKRKKSQPQMTTLHGDAVWGSRLPGCASLMAALGFAFVPIERWFFLFSSADSRRESILIFGCL